MAMDRFANKPRGPYQLAIKAERTSLQQGLLKFLDDINRLPQMSNQPVAQSDIDNIVRFTPNARFAYVNKLIKTVLRDRKAKMGDVEFIDTIWMNDDAKRSLKKLISPFSDGSAGFSVPPTQSRSGIKFVDMPGKGMKIPLYNPGNVVVRPDAYRSLRDNDNAHNDYVKEKDKNTVLSNNLHEATTEIQMLEDRIQDLLSELSNAQSFISKNDDNSEKSLTAIVTRVDKHIQSLMDELNMDRDFQDLFNRIDDGEILRTLSYFRDKVSDNTLSYGELKKMASSLTRMTSAHESKYLLSLSNPWLHRNARIPTLISPPSATFSIRSIAPLTTNTTGNVAFVFNPFVLCHAATFHSGLGINNNVGLTGGGSSNFFLSTNFGQTLPADFYTKYRLFCGNQDLCLSFLQQR
jgi:hypothetical protein